MKSQADASRSEIQQARIKAEDERDSIRAVLDAVDAVLQGAGVHPASRAEAVKRVLRERDALHLCRLAVETTQAFIECGQQPTLDPGGSGEYRRKRRDMEQAHAAAVVALARKEDIDAADSMVRQVVTPQPAPVPRGRPVTPELLRWIRGAIPGPEGERVAALIEARDAFGRAKYGQALHHDDGRDVSADFGQELADALQYGYAALMRGTPLAEWAPMVQALLALAQHRPFEPEA